MNRAAILLDDYYYGMPRKDILAKLKIPLPPDHEQRILRDPGEISFLGYNWEELFYFDNDEALRQIILIRATRDGETFRSIQEELINSGWTPVSVEMDEATFDIFGLANRRDHEITNRELKEFESQALEKNDSVTVYFFPAAFADKVLTDSKIKFWANAIDKAPENFCLLSFAADANNIKLSFTAPLLSRKAALKYGEKIKR